MIFVETPVFTSLLYELLSDDEYSEFQQFLAADPNAGDVIITSAVKRVDNAVFDTVKRAVDGNLKGGENVLFGLKEDGVGLAPYHDWDTKLPQSVKDAVDAAKKDVVDGKVTVPDSVAK